MSQQSNLSSSQASSSQPRKCNKKPQEKKAIH
jgi:predicted metal-binding transcription factor (methanogenesis marker protein 9)